MINKFLLFSLFILYILTGLSCTEEGTDIGQMNNTSKPNILLVIADDMGIDATPGYDIGDEKPNMPNLEKMMNDGITFDNLWAYPTCTPTRSSIITGKYGFRTGVTQVGDVLSTNEVSLQRYLDNNNSGYSHAVIGKWHLSNNASHPNEMGITHYSGLLSGAAQSYNRWSFTENQNTQTTTEYITTKFTDLAIDWINEQEDPWFLWLAYTAPHTPFHLPLSELHSRTDLPDDQASIDANPLPYYLAMIESLDTEVGRLLSSMTQLERENTIVIFIGDNGTPGATAQEYNERRTKGSVYQGGINVPMIISGATVSRRGHREDALINSTDLYSTIADIAGIANPDLNDSKSFKSLLSDNTTNKREFVYSEIGNNNGGSDITIRNGTHKYILFGDGTEALYNLTINPLENPNLLNANQLPLSTTDADALDFLLEKLNEIR
jgi:arylsulfatase A-like enzyme